MGRARHGRTSEAGGGHWLALIALLLIVLIPPGYMAASDAHGPALVICSGHGPVSMSLDAAGHPSKAPKSRPDAPCAFAGHGVAPTPTPPVTLSLATAVGTVEPSSVPTDLTPGRGLAAPPPPSQAPPAIT